MLRHLSRSRYQCRCISFPFRRFRFLPFVSTNSRSTLPRRLCSQDSRPNEPAYAANKKLRWKQIQSEQRRAWEALGWTEASWDDGDARPASSDKEWVELTETEKNAARSLGYDASRWANDETSSSAVPLLSGSEPFVKCKEQRWADMDLQYQRAWTTLGWSQARWDGEDDAPPSATAAWDLLSVEQQEAAVILGYSSASWDQEDDAIAVLAQPVGSEPFSISKIQTWDSMAAAHRGSWQVLGWTKGSWENGERKPASAFQGWADLNETEKLAAVELGYTRAIWDQDQASIGSRLEEGIYNLVQSALGSRGPPKPSDQAVAKDGDTPGLPVSPSESQPVPSQEKPFRVSKGQRWNEMHLSHRNAWLALGWTQGSWESDGVKPASATKSWAELSESERLAAIELGYTEPEWNGDDDVEQPSFFDWLKAKAFGSPSAGDAPTLASSPPSSSSNTPVQRFEKELPFIICKRQTWDEMKHSHRTAWQELGWTKKSWDEDGIKPMTDSLDWAMLSDTYKNAATRLGFTESTWNQEEEELPERTSSLITLGQFLQGKSTGAKKKKTGRESNDSSLPPAPPSPPKSKRRKSGTSSPSPYVLIFVPVAIFVVVKLIQAYSNSNDTSKKPKDECNRSGHMWRKILEARINWRERCEQAGLSYHSAEGIRWPDGRQDPYWTDGAAYIVDEHGKHALELAAWRLHHMCLEAVSLVVQSEELMDLFEIPVQLRPRVKASWDNREPDVLGRFDLLYDGTDDPKMLEYNADTPTILIESARAQEDWLRDQKVNGKIVSEATQFNTIDSLLQKAWKKVLNNQELTVISTRASEEEARTADYIANSVKEAGLDGRALELTSLVYSPGKSVVDSSGKPLKAIWKLYPYEWLCDEELGQALLDDNNNSNPKWMEPAWKLIVANKAILPLLWKMFPNHPNLLPAFYDIEDAMAHQQGKNVNPSEYGWVAKPKFGREGVGVRYSFDSPSLDQFAKQATSDLEELRTQSMGYSPEVLKSIEQAGQAKLGRHQSALANDRLAWAGSQLAGTVKDLPFPPLGKPVFQEYYDPPVLQGRRPVLGLWVINGTPAGLCFREDIVATTNNDSCFVPHYVVPTAPSVTIKNAKRPGVNGTYVPIGRLGDYGLYEKEATADQGKMFLRRGRPGWQIADVPDAEECLATSDTTLSNAHGYFSEPLAWREYDESAFDFVPSGLQTRLEPVSCGLQEKDLRPLNETQARIRRTLYGDRSVATPGEDPRTHSGGGGGSAFFNRHFPGGTSSSSRPSGSRGKTGRTGSRGSKPHPTGSYGSTMGSNS